MAASKNRANFCEPQLSSERTEFLRTFALKSDNCNQPHPAIPFLVSQIAVRQAPWGCLRVLPTVGFPVAQFNPIQQPLMAVGIVPKAASQG
jgi:hypothetical protein